MTSYTMHCIIKCMLYKNYFSFGNGDKNLIIIPGISITNVKDSIDFITKRYELLTQDYKITVIDRREKINEKYTFDTMVSDIEEMFDELDIKNASILATSQGGMIAQCFAYKHPETINKLILCSTAEKLLDNENKIIEKWIDFSKTREISNLAKAFCHDIYSLDDNNTIENMENLLKSLSDEQFNRFEKITSATFGFNSTSYANKINCPVLILASYGDRIFSHLHSKTLNKLINNSILYIYDEKFSHAFYDEADDFIEKVKNFLKRH